MPSPASRASRVPFLLWAALPVAVAGWLRLRNLGGLEPFVDEGANILTALDPRVRLAFEPLEQGRPLLGWLFAPAGWFPAHALLVARLMSALAGLVSMAALGWTLHALAGRIASLTGLWLWAALPLAVWHERLALQDPFVTTALAGSLALMTAGSRPAAKRSMAWWAGAGGLFGIAFLLKISALLALPWFGLLHLAVQQRYGRGTIDRRLVWWAAGALAPVLALGPDLLRLGSKLGRYGALPGLDDNLALSFAGRFRTWLGWYADYGGWPLLLLLILALALAAHQRSQLAWWCAGGWALSLLTGSFFFNNVYARYTMPDHLPLVLFLSLAVSAVSTGWWRRAALSLSALAVTGWGFVSAPIAADPAHAAVPPAEIAQYVTGPWSGHGLNDVRRFLTAYADRNNTRCLVLVHRYLRPGCYGLLLAERGDPRIGVVPFTIYEPAELAAALPGLHYAAQATGQRAAFFILYEGSLYPTPPWLEQPGAPAHRVHTVDRGNGEAFSLYQIGGG